MSNKVKSIQLDIKLHGNGVVNFDGDDLKFLYMSLKDIDGKRHRLDKRTDSGQVPKNIKYAKKNFYERKVIMPSGEVKVITEDYLKVSADALRKEIFADEYTCSSPNVMHDEYLLHHYITSATSIVRGYMFANKSLNLKRKGCLYITDAEQVELDGKMAQSYLEFHSSSMKRGGEEKDENSKGEISLHTVENVGDVAYRATGVIDTKELPFISGDNMMDRLGFNSDDKNFTEVYQPLLARTFGGKLYNKAYYKMKNNMVQIPELGVYLDEEDTKFLVKFTLMGIMGINFKRSKARCYTESLRVRAVYNPLVQTEENQEGWVTLRTEEDVDNFLKNLEFYRHYEEVDFETAKKDQARIIEQYQAANKKDIEDEEDKKLKKEAAKAAKAAKAAQLKQEEELA